MICNLSKRVVLARRPVTALGFAARACGMIGREFRDFDAMIFHHCGAIHTLGMRMPIDAIFVDSENRICALRQGLLPWTPFVRAGHAVAVIELPAGAIARTNSEPGDILDLNAELTEAASKELTKKGLLATARIAMSCPGETSRP